MTAHPHQTTQERLADERVGRLGLWFGMLAGPIAWTARFLLGYLLVPATCDFGAPVVAMQIGLTLAMAAITGVAGVISWRNWRRAREDEAAQGPGNRTGFMALYGVMSSVFFALLMLAEGSMVLVIDPCLQRPMPHI